MWCVIRVLEEYVSFCHVWSTFYQWICDTSDTIQNVVLKCGRHCIAHNEILFFFLLKMMESWLTTISLHGNGRRRKRNPHLSLSLENRAVNNSFNEPHNHICPFRQSMVRQSMVEMCFSILTGKNKVFFTGRFLIRTVENTFWARENARLNAVYFIFFIYGFFIYGKLIFVEPATA